MSTNGNKELDCPVLVLGGTGFVGRRLILKLLARNFEVRTISRSPEKARAVLGDEIQIIEGDLYTGRGLEDALAGVKSAYYLVHSMGGRTIAKNREYAVKDRICVDNFNAAASNLDRVIYLGGLGEVTSELSEHLRSRAEIAKALMNGPAESTVLRAAVIIGAGGASYEMLRYLTERLPVMICPKWINTRIQPIAVGDVVAYLAGCLENPSTSGQVFDIGGPEILTYRKMMQMYAKARGLRKRIIFTVPVLTPQLAAYWVDLVTPVPSGIAHPLIEGMRNEVVCRDEKIDEHVKIEKTAFIDAVRIAVSEETSGPGTHSG